MPPVFAPIPGAQGFQQSNPSVLATASLLGSLQASLVSPPLPSFLSSYSSRENARARASEIQVFRDAGGMPALRARSERLTRLLEDGLRASAHFVAPARAAARFPSAIPSPTAPHELLADGPALPAAEGSAPPPAPAPASPCFTIITPSDPAERGAQLSLLFLPPGSGVMQRVFDGLKAHGVVGDERRPDVIRLAPAPLYNTEHEVRRCVAALEVVLDGIASHTSG
jgi:kynureninase